MIRLISELKDIHKGNDIWVLGSGPSMNHIDNSFFENKITIGVNRICKFFKCNYIVAKDDTGFESILNNKKSSKLILSKHHGGTIGQRLNKVNVEHYIFSHPEKKDERPDISVIKKNSNQIVVSYSTITSAIHLAAYMGAKNIIICGHDCGTIDGYSTIKNYYKSIKPVQITAKGYINWLKIIELDTLTVNSAIKKEYLCNIHSLNPFMNLNATQHKYIHSSRYKEIRSNEIKRPTKFNPIIPWINFIKSSISLVKKSKNKILNLLHNL